MERIPQAAEGASASTGRQEDGGWTGAQVLPITAQAAFSKDLPCGSSVTSATHDLAVAAARATGQNSAPILRNRGPVVAEASLQRAHNSTEVIKRSAWLIPAYYAVGPEPPALPDKWRRSCNRSAR